MIMIDLKDPSHSPTLDEIGTYIQNPVFQKFCSEIKDAYKCTEKIEYSCCSMEPGWNVKFKKSGKSLCTLYPRESYFTAMIVVGRKEKESVEEILPECTSRLQELYEETKEGNWQRWLMIDLEDHDSMYHDVLRLIKIRSMR